MNAKGNPPHEKAALTHLSLFSGIGGIDLAAEWAGFETVGQCEWADYPTKVLEKHWPDVPRWRDIRTLTGEGFYERTGLRTVDLISGGFPCQPFSVAGKQKGKGDDRYLWPEMLRVIRELKPVWVLGENVPGILRIAGGTVCQDLEREGYGVGIFDYEAAAVGAPHRRERIFFVAHTWGSADKQRCISTEFRGRQEKAEQAGMGGCVVAYAQSIGCNPRRMSFGKEKKYPEFGNTGENVCHTPGKRLQNGPGLTMGGSQKEQESKRPDRRTTKPGLGRMADGLSGWMVEPAGAPRIAKGIKNRVDRLKCLGNAVVPQQVYPILAAIAEIERANRQDLEAVE